MFCDMVGSTALASRLDPEELQEVMTQYHDRVSATVTRFGGFVARWMGDGVLAYFGWPTADEADTERAVRAGLAVIDAAGSVMVDGECLQARVGIATGLVVVGAVVGTGAAREHNVAGETPNLAARLQALAEPETLVVADATHDLIAGLFDCQDLGAVALKGFPRTVRVWRVVQERPVRSRFEAMRPATLPPLIGRDEELDLLISRWRQAKQGAGQMVLISGEPGIGKSRLIAGLIERLAGEECQVLRYYCSSHQRDSALHPVISQIEHQAGFTRTDSPAEKFPKLETLLAPACPSTEELALLSELVSVPVAGPLAPLRFSPQQRKEKTFAALWRWLERLAASRPLLVILEDAHWADPTTRDLTDLVADRLPGQPILLLVTFRPEFTAPWVGQGGVTLLALNRLGRREAAAIAAGIDDAGTLSRELLDRIVVQSDGVPLFIEELTKSVVEAERGASQGAAAHPVPSSLQGSLLARLDRLAGAKQVAQIGAVIGREFSYELLAAVAPMPDPALVEGLERLVAAGLLFARGRPPEAFYRFKHSLVQDTAYESLLRSRRGPFHAKIVTALRRLEPNLEATRPELFGHHCAQAGLAEEAAEYFSRAGEQSITRSAIGEARAHLQRGSALAASMSENPARHALEARLLLALGSVSVITEGYGRAELAATLERAVALSRLADQKPLLIRALFGEWAYKVHRGDLATALVAATEMVALAERETERILYVMAATCLGINYAYAGRLLEARDIFEKCLAEPSISEPPDFGSPHPQDHEVLARTYLATTLARLGQGRRADDEARKAIERGRELKHHPSLAMALTMGCRQAWLLRDEQLVQERATELIALSEEQGFPYWLARGRCYAGWVAVVQGRVEDGIALLQQALSYLESTDVAMGNIAGLVGDAYAHSGRHATALEYVDRALQVSAHTGEVSMDAELYRLRGVARSAPPIADAKSAEQDYLRAIEISRNQAARLWELRAATSLSRLWLEQGKSAAALDVLNQVRACFVDGYALPDLAEAELLIKELIAAGNGASRGRADAEGLPIVTVSAVAEPGGPSGSKSADRSPSPRSQGSVHH